MIFYPLLAQLFKRKYMSSSEKQNEFAQLPETIVTKEPIIETETDISYLGVTLEKAKNAEGQFVPRREQYKDFINDKDVALPLQRDVATAWLSGEPLLIEGGTSLGKTTTIRKMAAELGWEVHYANLTGATDVEDLMGRYIPNPFKVDRTKLSNEQYVKIVESWQAHTSDLNPATLEAMEFIFADGKVTSGLRQEEGKKKIIILDEFNASAPNILIRLHEVLDALERGGEVILSEDASEAVVVDKDKTKIVALMNPPGKGYFGREPLDPAQLRRWVYKKMPSELPDETFSYATDALFGAEMGTQTVKPDMFLEAKEQPLTTEQLQEVPGVGEILEKYKEFHKAAKELLKNRKIAGDQPQTFTYDDRMEPRRVRDFIQRFYNGDINETFQRALKYYYANKLESEADREKLSELIRLVEYKPKQAESKRKGANREKKKEKKEKEETPAEIFADKSAVELASLEKILGAKKRELVGTTIPAEITAKFKWKDEKGKEKVEKIILDFEKEMKYFKTFYEKYGVEFTEDFETEMAEIWEANRKEIEKEIKEKGFNEILFVPGGLALPDLHQKMTEGYNTTYEGDNFKAGGSFAGVEEKNNDARIILLHNSEHIKDNPILAKTLGKTTENLQKEGESLMLSDDLIFQRKIFDQRGFHIDSKHSDGNYYWSWCPGSKVPQEGGGFRVVFADWFPDLGRLYVDALDADYSVPNLGCRLSRCFKKSPPAGEAG